MLYIANKNNRPGGGCFCFVSTTTGSHDESPHYRYDITLYHTIPMYGG